MQSSQYALARAGVIVLHESFDDSAGAIVFRLKALQKKPALIVKARRLDQ
jgi:hypothetical protein